MINETVSMGWNVGMSTVPYVTQPEICNWFCESDKIKPIITLVATFLAIATYSLMGWDYFRNKSSVLKKEMSR